MAWFQSIVTWVLGKLFGNPSAPTSAEVVAKDDGAQTQALKTEVQSDAAVQKASDASADVLRVADSDAKLRQYEATDPNNRDN